MAEEVPVAFLGVLNPLCDDLWLETVWHIIAWASWSTFLPCIAFAIAFIFGAWFRYDSCTLPRIALNKWLFWLGWIVVHLVFGIGAGWYTYYYQGRFCDAYIQLIIIATWFIWGALWPLAFFVFGSALIAGIVFVFMFIHIVCSAIACIILSFDVIVLLVHIIVGVWMAYQILQTFFIWRSPTWRRLPSPMATIRNIWNVGAGGIGKPCCGGSGGAGVNAGMYAGAGAGPGGIYGYAPAQQQQGNGANVIPLSTGPQGAAGAYTVLNPIGQSMVSPKDIHV